MEKWAEMIKKLAALIRAIDFTSIIKAVTSKVGGAWGWILNLFLGPFIKALEEAADSQLKKLEDAEDVKSADKEADANAEKNKEAMANAKTDEEFDEAARNSLK